MPKKRAESNQVPINILEHLRWWGLEIRQARVAQRITAEQLGLRVGVSHPTIGRMEKGDPAVAASSYLVALYCLGLTGRLAAQPTADQRTLDSSVISKRAKPDKLGEELGYF